MSGDLIAILQEARRMEVADAFRHRGQQTLAEILAPRPWDGLLIQATETPAQTVEELEAKAAHIREWLENQPPKPTPMERLALSFVADALRLLKGPAP
ncbi:hypothetical protein RQ831_05485 [Roseomonas gilardii]|uniref:Uncharacterized protein n=1 Tax=Roseomonas gilardii TaxID=257708 RepID=A0ABU3MD40_9PROT|nr:hypothetical protein [Roseomonas gilardii]MDT8330498.1 hypothetical protein [Roseomonas gilardii]